MGSFHFDEINTRSYWIWVDSNPISDSLVKTGRRTAAREQLLPLRMPRETHRSDHVVMEADFGVMQLPTKGQQWLQAAIRKLSGSRRTEKYPPLESWGAQSPEDTLIANGLLASRSVRERTSAVGSYPVCSNVLWNPQGPNAVTLPSDSMKLGFCLCFTLYDWNHTEHTAQFSFFHSVVLFVICSHFCV